MAIIPGQWYTEGPTQFHRWLVKSDDNGTEYMVAKCWGDGDGDDESTARLIAAAPELLERLRAMVSGLECQCDTADPEHPLCDVCWSRQVIANAEGRTNDQ